MLKRAVRRADAAHMVQQLAAFVADMPPLPLAMLYGFLVGPLVVAIHEGGHAFAALCRTKGPVVVAVAMSGVGFDRRVGRVQFTAQRIRGAGGLCAYDRAGLAAWEVALIAIAGPAASLVAAAATFVLTSQAGGVLQGLLWAATFGGALSGIVCALPLTFSSGKGADALVLRLDGLQARDALRGRPRHAPPNPRSLDVEAGPVAVRDERRVASVPPPGF